MSSLNISGLSEETIEEIEDRAEESDATSRSEYMRWLLRAGLRIYDVDGVDREALDELTGHEEDETA